MTAKRWRFTAGCALFALVVAGLSSALGGNPVGTTLFRAIVAAVLFGAGGTAVRMAIATFLPELEQVFASADAPAGDDVDGVPGGTVDIVVEDDDLTEGDAFAGSTEDPVADVDDAVEREDGGQDDQDGDYVPSFDSGDDQPGYQDDDLVADAVAVDGDSDENASIQTDPTDAVDPKGVDTLPDVGGFSDSFEAPESIGMGEGERERSGSSDQDPAMMARALQTMLKRDA
ncbi:MAG: hypothetical protein EA403_06855 [Spirochaetaceae bacterium]|nr:MAG: hypothetical protein EA403_06855 [Spirochaetaceae bacterium]